MGPFASLTAILLLLPHLTAATVKQNGKKCDCFRTTGPSGGYFTNHIFQDFRGISASPAPPLLTSKDSSNDASVTHSYFKSPAWTKNWRIQHWNNTDSMDQTSATLMMINSLNNVYIENNPSDPHLSWLTLRTARAPTFQAAAEIDTVPNNMLFLSVRYLARISGDPGACAGFFTYLPPGSDPTSVQEADIEILTGAPVDHAQFTNQPSFDNQGRELKEASMNTTIPKTNDYSQWNVWRMDWMPGQTSWYVNDVSVANISIQTPKDPAGLIMNMWSDGGLWTGNMSVGQSAYLNVQWIEIAYNTSGVSESDRRKRDETSLSTIGRLPRRDPALCAAVCSLDENITAIGTPKLLYGRADPTWSASSRSLCIPIALIIAGVVGIL
ncbi:BgTH12-04858 [Blumeria graminis f. sp. triticale]|uniref:Bgt-1254 n=3 Tax=Blumeria graminis TaxID=34373 RepID=A0A061HGT8_BLUGR|nr:hypothetical protein BGT96224_1254 [Blumeria graminis f. sp. tritici 96224]CAD6499206.1 BgTH12-04858 [Blumeria graminis f. sp. triticale]VCU39323.1 Bgt-1254 [Blumeria graminis f. sp. tritici]